MPEFLHAAAMFGLPAQAAGAPPIDAPMVIGIALAVLAVALPAAMIIAAGKLAKATAARPIPQQQPVVVHAPAPAAPAPAPAARASGVRVRWDDEEVEFAPEEAAGIIAELIQDVFKDLTGQDKMLLQEINKAHQSGNLIQLSEDFRRGSPEHQYYRRLRDAHLIRPIEGKFIPGARLEMTEFGVSVIQRFPMLLTPDDTGVGIPAPAMA
jgi:hypothetical protein